MKVQIDSDVKGFDDKNYTLGMDRKFSELSRLLYEMPAIGEFEDPLEAKVT